MISLAPAEQNHRTNRAPRGGWHEACAVVIVSAILASVFTYPIAFKLGRVGRVDNGDGQLSIWNVAWVAHALAVDPLRVFDANIFYPHRGTLAYSENNLGATPTPRSTRRCCSHSSSRRRACTTSSDI